MWRPAQGATSRPGPSRPASGYGRVLGRPGPPGRLLVDVRSGAGALDPSMFEELPRMGEPVEQEVEATAPVRP